MPISATTPSGNTVLPASQAADIGKQALAQSQTTLVNSLGGSSATSLPANLSGVIFQNAFLGSLVSSNATGTINGSGKNVSSFSSVEGALAAGNSAQAASASSLFFSLNPSTNIGTDFSSAILGMAYLKAGVKSDTFSTADTPSGVLYNQTGSVTSDLPPGSYFEYQA